MAGHEINSISLLVDDGQGAPGDLSPLCLGMAANRSSGIESGFEVYFAVFLRRTDRENTIDKQSHEKNGKDGK